LYFVFCILYFVFCFCFCFCLLFVCAEAFQNSAQYTALMAAIEVEQREMLQHAALVKAQASLSSSSSSSSSASASASSSSTSAAPLLPGASVSGAGAGAVAVVVRRVGSVKTGFFRQSILLSARAFNHVARDPSLLALTFAFTIIAALVLGWV
jgi:hypothetical protein